MAEAPVGPFTRAR
jgi:23S rRNA pseudoU1915 N3-methylase RlmH